MDQPTITALKGSIKKWEAIVNDGAVDHQAYDCPLCELFRKYESYNVICGNCPVALAANKDGCVGTPHDEWNTYCDDCGENHEIFDEHSRRLAIKELEFLKSLLPKESDDNS